VAYLLLACVNLTGCLAAIFGYAYGSLNSSSCLSRFARLWLKIALGCLVAAATYLPLGHLRPDGLRFRLSLRFDLLGCGLS
jgi:hypothetical protein